MRNTLRFRILAVVAALSAVWAGLPLRAGEEPTPVVMQLDWIYNAQFAGLFQAIEQGYFADAGLAVELREAPKSVGVTEAILAEDGIVFGSSESNVLLVKRAEGAPVVALATMFQDSPLGWISLKETGVETVKDFAGKTIGIHADGEKVIDIALAKSGLTRDDFSMTKVGYDPVIIADKEVDLMQAYYLDEFVELQLMTDGQASIILARDNGYLAYSQVIFTDEATVEAHPEVVKAFLEATKKGWAYACANPEATVDLIIGKYNPDLDKPYQMGSLAKVCELVAPAGKEPLAPMDKAKWAASQDLFIKYGVIAEPADLDALLDFRFNP